MGPKFFYSDNMVTKYIAGGIACIVLRYENDILKYLKIYITLYNLYSGRTFCVPFLHIGP